MSPRLIAHYSLPRTGSTFIEVALRAYFSQHGGYQPLSEYFNVSLPVERQGSELVVDHEAWLPASFRQTLPEEELKAIKEARLQWLLASQGRYYFKVLGYQLSNQGLYRAFQDCEVILSYRQDEWAQLLSFILSYQSGQYYERGGIDWRGQRFVAQKETFVRFIMERQMYHRMKCFFNPRFEICFERFLHEGGRYMVGLGFDRPFDWDKVAAPEQQNRVNKEELIINLAEVRGWYEEALLELPSV